MNFPDRVVLPFEHKQTGSPGIDYPNYLRAPRTSFECRGKGNGYFSDPEAGCQAYHVCDNGRKYSFVCPVSTLFSDSIKTCDYWYNVKCQGGQRDPDQAVNERPEIEQPVFEETAPVTPEVEQPDREQERPEQPVAEGGQGSDAEESVPQPDDRPNEEEEEENPTPDDRESSSKPAPVTSAPPPVNTEGSDNTGPQPEPHEEEGPANQPDVVPENPMEESAVPNDWRRDLDSSTSSPKPKQWTTYPTAGADSQTTKAPKWRTFEATTKNTGTASSSTAPSDNNSIPDSDTTSTDKEEASSTSSVGDEFRSENWVEHGMPSSSSTAEPGNESLSEEGNGSNATLDPVSNVNRYSRGVQKRPQKRQQGNVVAEDNGLIGSMMKWAAAASSALSLRQGEPKITQTDAGVKYSSPKGPNPYIPFEEQERRVREQRASRGTGVPQVTSPQPVPAPSTESALNPPYAYPYEPSVSVMANSGMHVSLNERKVYTGDRSRKGGDDVSKRATPLKESVDHPNPWTFPMTDQETAEVAAKPRDTYRARRRDDPNDVNHRGKGAAETGSAFDMMMASSSSSTTEQPRTVSTAASFVSGVTEQMPSTTKASSQTKSVPKASQRKQPGNFITGEVMPNGQCRCPLPDSDVYFS